METRAQKVIRSIVSRNYANRFAIVGKVAKNYFRRYEYKTAGGRVNTIQHIKRPSKYNPENTLKLHGYVPSDTRKGNRGFKPN